MTNEEWKIASRKKGFATIVKHSLDGVWVQCHKCDAMFFLSHKQLYMSGSVMCQCTEIIDFFPDWHNLPSTNPKHNIRRIAGASD